ncbi:thioredoxin family protein [Solemya velesiana gill symbiont]|uniref:Thioredoxin n=1 Tax=Solemya velesiana gill symbiont TaxID=1918948 RepID=A0A1T2KV41_9GAMM|nr:thioredoxin fold domain-containing protein [Solemya velesiana gill symbiont]OOZ36738.1 thioredoxin [Solemya velesiana gill symbiont]
MFAYRYLAAVAITCLLFFPFTSHSATTPPAQGKMTGGKQTHHPDWFKESFLDIAEDVEEASDAEKHVILFMHLNNCPYCYKMTEENFKHAPYTEFIKENFDVIVINIKGDREVAFDENTTVIEKDLADMLQVMYTPTIIFLNPQNKTVARVNGYRSVPNFKHILDYVDEKAYTKTSLAKYLDEKKSGGSYKFRDHPQLKTETNLQELADKPLAVLFEDKACVLCDQLHDGHFRNAEINDVLKNFTFVRFDALSSETIIDVEGNKTTPKAYTEKLGLNYRPGIVLFDKGKEVIRIESMLYTYHFQEVLRYVGERHYEKYPEDFYEYLGTRSEAILKSGKDIDLSK